MEITCVLYSSVKRKMESNPRFVSRAEYEVGGLMIMDVISFMQIEVLFIDMKIIAHSNERVTRLLKNS